MLSQISKKEERRDKYDNRCDNREIETAEESNYINWNERIGILEPYAE